MFFCPGRSPSGLPPIYELLDPGPLDSADIACTSANAAKIVNSLPDEEIIFVPDRNRGAWVHQQTAKRLIAIANALSGEPLSFARLADRVETASDMMMGDLAEWQLVFRTRPLSLPV
mgnify:CR=1 FL=1